MRYGLPALHDPDNSRLRLVVAIRSYTLVGLLVLLFSFFGLDLIDLDAVSWMGKVKIHREGVRVADVFTSWLFIENAIIGASKGLEGPLEFGVIYAISARSF